MATTERIASSQRSSNLSDKPVGLCDVDYLRASGMVSQRHPLGMALFRLKFSEIVSEAKFCHDSLIDMMMRRRGVKIDQATESVENVLIHYLSDRCDDCGGTGYTTIQGTPTLSDKPCAVCKGDGVIKYHPKNEHETWLQSQIAMMETEAAGAVMKKLRDSMF